MIRAVGMALDATGALHGCIAAAGTGTFGPLLDTSREQWDTVLNTNLTGTMLAVKHAAPRDDRCRRLDRRIWSFAGILTIAG